MSDSYQLMFLLQGQIESACSTAESDLLAHALLSVPLWKHDWFQVYLTFANRYQN